MSYSSRFQQEWLALPVFQGWIMKHESQFKAYCKLCTKIIGLSNMGKRALTSHAKSKSHKKAASLKQGTAKIEQFVKYENKEGDDDNRRSEQSTRTEMRTVSLPTEEPHSSHQEKSYTSQQLLKTYVTGESVTKVEFLWSMKNVLSQFSFYVSSHMVGLFENMFPDSAIAVKFAFGKTKMNHLICFGIGPYFREELLQRIKEAECLTISFDESLIKDFQTEQTDIIVNYFHEDRVVIQYLDSQFIGHTTASDLLKSLKCSFSKLNNRKLLQISMYGPRINWKLLSLLCEDTEKENADLQNY